jgi:hypothetical protein
VHNVLVKQNSGQNLGLLELSSGNLFTSSKKEQKKKKSKQLKSLASNEVGANAKLNDDTSLLNTGISLNVNVRAAILGGRDSPHSLERKTAHHVAPLANKLGANGRLEQVQDLGVARDIDRLGNLLNDLDRVLQTLVQRRDDRDRMLAIQEWLSRRQDLTG